MMTKKRFASFVFDFLGIDKQIPIAFTFQIYLKCMFSMDETNQNNQGENDQSKLKELESELENINQKAGGESTGQEIKPPDVPSEGLPITPKPQEVINQQPETVNQPTKPISQPTTQPMAPKMEKKSSQGKILKISLAMLFVTIFVAGLFALKDVLFNKKDTPEPTPSPVSTQMPIDVTKSWLNYNDKVSFYELNYPPDWSVTPTPEKGFGGVATFLGTSELGEEIKVEVGKHLTALERNETLEEFDKRVTVEATPSALKRTREVIEEKLNVYKQITTLSGGDGTWSNGIYYLFNEGDDVFFAMAYTNNPDVDEPFFDKIVSTFRFKKEQKVECPEQRPEACTEECLANPPYICGSDNESYCTTCKACANEEVDFYTIQYDACEKEE